MAVREIIGTNNNTEKHIRVRKFHSWFVLGILRERPLNKQGGKDFF